MCEIQETKFKDFFPKNKNKLHPELSQIKMEGLYFEYVIDYLTDDHFEIVHEEKALQKPNKLTATLKDLIKKLAKPKQ